MGLMINGISCDTYAHIDRDIAGDTIYINLNDDPSSSVTAILYENNKIKPLFEEEGVDIECYIMGNSESTLVTCELGDDGQIVVPIPSDFLVDNENLLCEICVSSTANNNSFRYKAMCFRVAIIDEEG